MKNRLVLLIMIFISMILFSCQQIISVDIPDSTPKLVVQGEILTDKDSSYVYLTKSVSYYSNDVYPTVNNAVVTVSYNGKNVLFKPVGNGVYKPDSGFVPPINTQYSLNINYDGNTYTSTTFLDQLFNIDYVDSVYTVQTGGGGPGSGGPGGGGPGGGKPRSGSSVRLWWTDTRMPGKYTYIRFRHTQLEQQQDSFLRNIVLLDNSQTNLNSQISFQLPRRYQPGDSVFVILKSCDYNMYYFFQAYRAQTSSPPGPFQTPPANLPTNVRGGAIGYFVASDIRKLWKVL